MTEKHGEAAGHKESGITIRHRPGKGMRKDWRKEEIRRFLIAEKDAVVRELERECSDILARMHSEMEEYRRHFLESLALDMRKMAADDRAGLPEMTSQEEHLKISDDIPAGSVPSFYGAVEVIPSEAEMEQAPHVPDISDEHQHFAGQPQVENHVKGYLATIDGDMIEAILDDFIGGEDEPAGDLNLSRQARFHDEKTYSEIDELLAQTGFVPADYQIMQGEESSAEPVWEVVSEEPAASEVVQQNDQSEDEIVRSGNFDAFLTLLEKPR
jgi:hypothetical protein